MQPNSISDVTVIRIGCNDQSAAPIGINQHER